MPSTSLQTDTSAPHGKLPRLRMRAALAMGVLAWVVGIAWGLQKIETYSSTPGRVAVTPPRWPGSQLVSPRAGRATLVMFIHPQCSCTRASLEELRAILDKTRGTVSAWVVALQPKGVGDEWLHSDTWDAARTISGVTVVTDKNGTEADRFGALTSGHAVLYSAEGKLEFSGGITAARGHVGDNTGEERVVSLVETGKADSNRHEVYGCGLRDPNPRRDAPARPAP
ncbi:MAG: RedB protein [Gammaproteobacteria bacterium]